MFHTFHSFTVVQNCDDQNLMSHYLRHNVFFVSQLFQCSGLGHFSKHNLVHNVQFMLHDHSIQGDTFSTHLK